MYARPSTRARSRRAAPPPPTTSRTPSLRGEPVITESHPVRAVLAVKRRLESDRDASRQVWEYLCRRPDDEAPMEAATGDVTLGSPSQRT